MKCYKHLDADAIDTCTMCKKPMCAKCRLDYDGKVVCKPCAMPLVDFFAHMEEGVCSFPKDPKCSGNLMESLEKTVKDRVAGANLSPREDEVRIFILRWMARNGTSPSQKDIMDGLGLPGGEIKQAIGRLRDADIISAWNGVIASAYPFSANETGHRVTFNDGHTVNAMCAVDALGIASMLGEDVTIQSKCPNCERAQSIVIKDGRIVAHAPAEIVVFIGDRGGCGRVADTCCPHINFFCSESHLQQWKWKNPLSARGETYALEEALEYGRGIFGDMLVKHNTGCKGDRA